MQTLNEAIKDGYFTFQFYTNTLNIVMLNVLKETEKAIQVEHEHNKKKTWLPKSGLTAQKNGGFTLKKWLKDAILKEHNIYKMNALGL